MSDTPEHVRALQLKIWLAKSPGERLLRALQDNEVLYLFWKEAKEAAERLKHCRVGPMGTPEGKAPATL